MVCIWYIFLSNFEFDLDYRIIRVHKMHDIVHHVNTTNEKPEIIAAIQSSGKLEENTEKLLVQAIEEYKKVNK